MLFTCFFCWHKILPGKNKSPQRKKVQGSDTRNDAMENQKPEQKRHTNPTLQGAVWKILQCLHFNLQSWFAPRGDDEVASLKKYYDL